MHKCDERRNAGGKTADLLKAQCNVHKQNHKRDEQANKALLEELRAHGRVNRARFHHVERAVCIRIGKLRRDCLLLIERHSLVACKGQRNLVRVGAERLAQRNGNVAASLLFYEGRDLIRIDFAVYGILDHCTADELNVHLRAANEVEDQADDDQADRDAEQNFSILIEIKIELFHYLSAPPNSHFLRSGLKPESDLIIRREQNTPMMKLPITPTSSV